MGQEIKILAEHQPNFMPYLGVWEKFILSDVFIWAVKVQFARQDYQHRVMISSPYGSQWLSIKISGSKKKLHKMIEDVVLAEKPFDLICGRLNAWYSNNHRAINLLNDYIHSRNWEGEKLFKFNLGLWDLFFDFFFKPILGDCAPIVLLDNEIDNIGNSTEVIVNHCLDLKCNAYLSGAGGKNYLQTELFAQNGIKLIWQEYENFVYKQKYSNVFLPGMSILDALVNDFNIEKFIERTLEKKVKIQKLVNA